MATVLPPAPIGIADTSSYLWKDWFEKLRRATEANEVVDSITLSSTGYIKGGQTEYNVGTGFFLGYSGGAYKLSIGSPGGNHLLYDGTTLYYNGSLAPSTVGNSQIIAGAVDELQLAAGAVTAAKTNIAAIDNSTGDLAANSVTTNAIQSLAITSDKIYAGAITSDKITVATLAAISANLGSITAGYIDGVTITGSLFRTAASGQRIEIDSSGISLSSSSAASPYNTASKTYNDASNTYGNGVLAYINNTSKSVPFYINAEQSVGDFHFYNRGSDPTGAAEIGDVAVVSGKLKICTAAGTPGTWTIVGTQT